MSRSSHHHSGEHGRSPKGPRSARSCRCAGVSRTGSRRVPGHRVWPVRGLRSHPFAARWNHNTHYFPLLASRIPETTDRVLDVGCGDGTFCRFVARDDRRVVGVDIDVSALPADSAGVQYVIASAEELPFADGTFGAVTMTMVLHHVQAERALAEAARVIAPGGVLLILGYGRYGGWRDAPHEVRDLLTHRLGGGAARGAGRAGAGAGLPRGGRGGRAGGGGRGCRRQVGGAGLAGDQ